MGRYHSNHWQMEKYFVTDVFSYEILWRVPMMAQYICELPQQTTGFLSDKACRHRLCQSILLCVSMHLVSQPTRVSMHFTLKFYSSSFSGFQVMKLTHHHNKVILIFQHHIAVPPKQFKQTSRAERGTNVFTTAWVVHLGRRHWHLSRHLSMHPRFIPVDMDHGGHTFQRNSVWRDVPWQNKLFCISFAPDGKWNFTFISHAPVNVSCYWFGLRIHRRLLSRSPH